MTEFIPIGNNITTIVPCVTLPALITDVKNKGDKNNRLIKNIMKLTFVNLISYVESIFLSCRLCLPEFTVWLKSGAVFVDIRL